MALKLFVVDDVSGSCDLRELVPYTGVTSADGTVVVTQSVGPNGQPLFDLSASVDVNVNNFSYNAVTKEITLTETDGDTYVVSLTDLIDVETVTTLVANPDGSYTYTSEDNTVTTIPAPVVATPSSVTQVVTGQEIATHTGGTGTTVSIQESVTTLADNADGSFTHVSEDGTITTISACDLISSVSDTGQFIGG